MKLSKHAEVLDQLHKLVEAEMKKEAEKPEATGKPGKDTNYTSVSEKTEHTDKNKVGPEKLTPQHHEQHKATDPSVPIAHAKAGEEKVEDVKTDVKLEEKAAEVKSEEKAAEVKTEVKVETKEGEKKAEDVKTEPDVKSEKSAAEIGKEILNMIDKFAVANKTAEKPEATGVPGKDTKYESVSEKTEHTDKNKMSPEKLSPQNHEQHKATDPCTPIAHAKAGEEKPATEEDVNKVASYEFGKTLAEMILKSAMEQEVAMAKEAGRRDFEQLIALATQELEAENTKTASTKEEDDANIKQAEQQGAQAFDELVKVAKHEQALAELNKQAEDFKVKLAAVEAEKVKAIKEAEDKLAAKEAELKKQTDDQREMAKWSALADYVTTNVFEKLKSEIVKSNG